MRPGDSLWSCYPAENQLSNDIPRDHEKYIYAKEATGKWRACVKDYDTKNGNRTKPLNVGSVPEALNRISR